MSYYGLIRSSAPFAEPASINVRLAAITMEKTGITLNENCRMCGVCVRQCQSKALYFEQKAGGEDKSTWNGILVYAEQERGKMHPVVFELIGEARKLAKKVGYKVYAVMVGTARTAE